MHTTAADWDSDDNDDQTGSHPSWSTFLRYCNICLFLFFCSVQKNSILSIYHTSEVHTSLQKKVYSFPPQNKGQAELHPPIFITAHTHPVHGGV